MAIGLFGILAISIGIDQVILMHKGLIAYDIMDPWFYSKIILSIAYFALIIIGTVCIIGHKFHTLLQEKYLASHYSDYINDLQEIARSNRFLKVFNNLWIDNIGNNKKSLSLIWVTIIPYLVISFLLWFFIVLI